jgi:hypothetical protein
LAGQTWIFGAFFRAMGTFIYFIILKAAPAYIRRKLFNHLHLSSKTSQEKM